MAEGGAGEIRTGEIAERDWRVVARVRFVRETVAHSSAWCSRRNFHVGEELKLYQSGRAGEKVDRTWRPLLDPDRPVDFKIGDECVEVCTVLEERQPFTSDDGASR